MENQENYSPLRKYVSVKTDKNVRKLEVAGMEWVKAAAENKLSYEVDWLGVPAIQTPEDLILVQELIFRIKPDFVVETGIAHGGGLIFYASLLELLGKGKVIGIDIEIREHNRKVIEAHSLSKKIELIEASSTSEEVIEALRNKIPKGSKVLVFLDSDHTKAHVLKELELYREFIISGCYIVVFDTITSMLADAGIADKKYIKNTPMEAVQEFLKQNDNFIIDKEFNKLFVSYSPDGYLKRVK
ncbi:MAG: CmcI family methyltransferase [bacterium]|nr:CmcI family methyltransferase [bacterium]